IRDSDNIWAVFICSTWNKEEKGERKEEWVSREFLCGLCNLAYLLEPTSLPPSPIVDREGS
ncbi:MAG TPA: hypothetical protein PLL28_10160, partial [Chitinophagales bacterium]|nr:hypothetical protein [Chitinophagales bacterium]